jgi:hypothetical protein
VSGSLVGRFLMVMPPADHTRFRLLAELPVEVTFKSITYRLVIAQEPVSGLWRFIAVYPGGFWFIEHGGSEETLRRALYRPGLELEPATVPRVIFERLVKEGRAEAVG